MTRRFEMVEGGSSKFWEITEQGTSFTVRYGKIGTNGQTQTKEFGTEDKARAAAAKLVAEKTGKGYAEVSVAPADAPDAPDAPRETTDAALAPSKDAATGTNEKGAEKAPKEKPPKAAAADKAVKADKAGKADKKEVPPIEIGGKPIGARALQNAADRMNAATTQDEWNAAMEKTPGSSYQRAQVLVHLLTHGAFTPSTRLHARSFVGVLASASPEVALRAMAGLPESAVETLTTETPVVTQYVPPLERIARVAPELLREATLPPTLAKVAAIVRAFHGESLTADEGASALAMAAQLLANGQQSIAGADDYGRPVPLDPVKLAHTFARLGGPHWIRAFPTPERLPVETAVAALEHESLEEAARAVGLFTYKLLRPRTEPAARFFEVAAKVDADKARYLRVAGVEHARTPDEIPVGAEDAIEPSHVQYEPGFAQLGTARLDAWAARWLATQPDALTTCDEHSAARTLGVWLSRLGKTALPFGDAMRATLLGEPLPYKHSPDDIDLRRYTGEFSSVTPSGAEHVLRVAATKARAREAEGAHPEILKGLRLLICAALAALPAELAVDESIDALVSLGDGLDYDAKNHVRRAVYRLPLVRAEQVVARTANELPDPFEELTYAREGSSEVAMRRFARLVASGRENETMWMRCGGSGGLVSLGPAFGPLLAEALGGETLSESFFTRLGKVVHEGALAHVRQAVGQNVLDLASEMKKLCAELGGEHVVVYAMSVGKPGRGLSRIGGLPAGFAADDVPRGRGRKLMHAFTVDLVEVPELAAKHPGARTLSVWIQGWGEATTRAQSLVPKTEAEIAERPITTDAPALSLLRLEVPLEAFAKNPSERAEYARTLLYRKAGFLLGGPLWLQDGPWAVTPTFVAQYDERIAIGANFGDVGICYSFDDHAEWQCH